MTIASDIEIVNLIVNKMFCQLPDEKTKIVVKNNKNLPSKKNRRSKRKHKQGIKKHTKLASSMSSWAENFTSAASWQLKQQVAYWKARAKSLEYENSVLHDVIRKNQSHLKTSSCTENEHESRDVPEMDETQTENETANEDRFEEGEDFEVSDEFIDFLTANAKYKEEAKRERERLRVQQEEEESQLIIQEETPETSEEKMIKMKELYGDNCQRISALEISLLSSFIHESDKNKPSYWPNIPFNFNTS